LKSDSVGACGASIVKPDPVVLDEVPWAETLTGYDEARLDLYLRLLDAEAAGADWREVSRIVLKRDPIREPGRSYRCWEAHLKRARWIAAMKYEELIHGTGDPSPPGMGS
jgi:hypothetical protein